MLILQRTFSAPAACTGCLKFINKLERGHTVYRIYLQNKWFRNLIPLNWPFLGPNPLRKIHIYICFNGLLSRDLVISCMRDTYYMTKIIMFVCLFVCPLGLGVSFYWRAINTSSQRGSFLNYPNRKKHCFLLVFGVNNVRLLHQSPNLLQPHHPPLAPGQRLVVATTLMWGCGTSP